MVTNTVCSTEIFTSSNFRGTRRGQLYRAAENQYIKLRFNKVSDVKKATFIYRAQRQHKTMVAWIGLITIRIKTLAGISFIDDYPHALRVETFTWFYQYASWLPFCNDSVLLGLHKLNIIKKFSCIYQISDVSSETQRLELIVPFTCSGITKMNASVSYGQALSIYVCCCKDVSKHVCPLHCNTGF